MLYFIGAITENRRTSANCTITGDYPAHTSQLCQVGIIQFSLEVAMCTSQLCQVGIIQFSLEVSSCTSQLCQVGIILFSLEVATYTSQLCQVGVTGQLEIRH